MTRRAKARNLSVADTAFFVFMGLIVLAILAAIAFGIYSCISSTDKPGNTDPRVGTVYSGTVDYWCDGGDMFYQPSFGLSRPITIRTDSPECRA